MPVTPKTIRTDKKTEELNSTYVPTLFIGLGGTGKDVLMRLRKKLYDKDGPVPRPYLRYLMLDTDKENWCPEKSFMEEYESVRPEPGESVGCQISEQQFFQAFDLLEKQNDERFITWLKPELRTEGPKAVANGAGTQRQFGRMAFMLQYDPIRQQIQANLKNMLDAVGRLPAGSLEGATIQPSTVEVVIITSIAGGTGAGMFLDIAYLVKDILRSDPTLANLRKKYTTLIAVLPSVFEKLGGVRNYKRLQQNAYAALLEMEHYGTSRTGDEMFLGELKQGRGNRNRVGFEAPWKHNEFIEGQGWEVCYLIDNVNPLRRQTPLEIHETYEMIADYLFLDFQRSDFALRKRSNRCNLSQYQNDMIAVEVRNPSLKEEFGDQYEKNLDVVYAAKSGCAFSSFGLSEISFSRARVYRAAAYLLASRLVLEHWLGSAGNFQQSQYQEATKTDFYKYGEADGKTTFHPETLLRSLYQGDRNNWYEAANADCQSSREVHFTQGSATIRELLKKHQGLLQAGPPVGQALQRLRENAGKPLAGTPLELGALRQRIWDAVRRRVDENGVAVTRELLNHYRATAELVPALVAKVDLPALDGMARLEEADSLWFPARSLAQKIEFPRACDSCRASVLGKYRTAATPFVQTLMANVREYIGEKGKQRPNMLEHHGTLYDWLERAEEQLRKIGECLQKRFAAFRSESGSDRSQLLSPTTWTESNYNNQINRQLAIDPDIGPDAGGSGFNWSKLEERFFAQLKADRPHDFDQTMSSLMAFLDRWDERREHGEEAIKTIAETLAASCRNLLSKVALNLEEYYDGCVIDLLEIGCKSPERRERIDKFVRTSEPYLPMNVQVQAVVAGGYRPEPSNLLGLKKGDIVGASDANQEKLERDIDGWARDVGADLANVAKLTNVKTSLVICREVWGVPLQFYDNIENLHQAYMERGRDVEFCHIDYHRTWEALPEIRAIKPEVYEAISQHVDDAIFAMMRGRVSYRQEDKSYIVRVPNFVGGGANTYPLGSRISRIVKKICEEERIRNFLHEDRAEWESTKASPKRWAMLYASALWTYDSTQKEFVVGGPDDVSPLRNVIRALLMRFQRQLTRTEEGACWLKFLRLPDHEDQEACTRWKVLYEDLVDKKKVLVCASEFVPIYEVNWDAADKYEMPLQRQATQSQQQPPQQAPVS